MDPIFTSIPVLFTVIQVHFNYTQDPPAGRPAAVYGPCGLWVIGVWGVWGVWGKLYVDRKGDKRQLLRMTPGEKP